MHSSAVMNGQYQQIAPSSQSSQASTQHTHGTTWNQPARTAYNSGLNVQQRPHVGFHNGVYYTTPLPKWQTPTVQHQQAVSFSAERGRNNHHLRASHSSHPNSFGNMQGRNTSLQATNGLQAAPPPKYQFINSSFQCPPNNMKPNSAYTTYSTYTDIQDKAAHWNQQGGINVTQSTVTQRGNAGLTDKQWIQNSNSSSDMFLHMSQKTQYPNQLNSSHRLPLNPPAYPQEQSAKMITGTQPSSGTNSVYRSGEFVSSGKQVGPSMRTSRLMGLLKSGSPQTNETTSSAVDTRSTCEVFEMLTQSAVVNDIHSSPGRAGTRAVAVVQPLSQEGFQAAGGHFPSNPNDQLPQYTPPVQSSNQEKLYVSPTVPENNKALHLEYGSRIYPENPNNTSTISHSAASNDGNSDSAQFWDYVQNRSYQCDTGFEQASKIQVDQHVAPTAQQSRTPEVAVSQSKNPTDGCGYAKYCQSAKRKNRTQSDKLKPGGGEIKNYTVTIVQPAASENESGGVSPSTVLRFSVSPKSSEVKDTTAPVPSKSCHNIAPTSPQSAISEVAMSQRDDQGISENPTDPRTRRFDLSSLPTTPWVAAKLLKFAKDADKSINERLEKNVGKDMTVFDVKTLLRLYWGGKLENLLGDTSWYMDLMASIKEFFSKHFTLDTVVLSQVKRGFEEQLQNYHVLKHDEVYTEPPYISSWLNNTELDEIDKWFGPPRSVMRHHHASVSQPDDVDSVDSSPAEMESEMTNTVSLQTELNPGERQQAPNAETSLTQTASPEETESTDSNDPFSSVEICVLPPEVAKALYEQTYMSQNMDTDVQNETVMNSSVEKELSENIDVPLNDTEPESESPNAVEQVCCLSRWIETICGSAPPELVTCQCKTQQGLQSDETLDKERMSVQKDDWKNLGVIRSDSEIHSSTQGEIKAKGEAKVDSQIMTCCWPELFNEQSEPNAATEDDNKSDSDSDQKEQNNSHTSINSGHSSIILISEDKDEDLCSTRAENQSEPVADCIQTQFKSEGSMLTCSSPSNDKEVEHLPVPESEISQMSYPEEQFQEAQLTSAASLETEGEQTRKSAPKKTCSFDGKPDMGDRKRKRQKSLDGLEKIWKLRKYKHPADVHSQAVREGDAKRRNVDAANSKPSASNVRTLQLTLFGSVAQDPQVSICGRKKHSSSSEAMNDGFLRPPKVLMVEVKPETAPEEKSSVKGWIQEKCKRGFPSTKTWCRNKQQTQKRSLFSGATPKTPRTVAYTSPHKLSLSEMRTRNAKHYLSRKRKRKMTQTDKLKPGVGNMKKYAVSFVQPAGSESKRKENESHSVGPLQETNVLRFSVLPNTFSFKDRSSEMKDTPTSVPNASVAVEGKDKSPDKVIMMEKGVWLPNLEKKCSHPHLPAVPKTSSLFHEYKRKYKEMTQ